MKPIVQVRGVSKRYRIGAHRARYASLRESLTEWARQPFQALRKKGGQQRPTIWALKNVTFDVMPGEVVGIIGRNGAGKSTLLKVLSRITEPTEGEIDLFGRVGSLLDVGTGFHPELTGRENIFLNGAVLGMKRAEIDRKFDEIVAFAEIEKFLDTPVKHYSSGMYVRLAFAVAAHLEPEILLVDEVLAVGDAGFQKKCLGKMEAVANSGRTVLFVSHNMGTIMQLCTSCILLSAGVMELKGTTKTVIDRYHDDWSVRYVGTGGEGKGIWFKSIETWGENGPQSSFAHSEPIRLRMVIGINELFSFQNVGVALLTRGKSRVFTVNRSVADFADASTRELVMEFVIEGHLIAPMEYSFLVALNTRTGTMTYEWHPDICPIRVYDDGTGFAFAEGFDYGCIIVKDAWNLIRRS